MRKTKIAFVGSGMIGGGLAVNALLNDYPTVIYDVAEPEKVEKTIQNVVQIMVSAGAFSEERGNELLKNASYTDDLKEAIKDVGFIQECVPEKIELKRSVYRQIQEVRGNEVLIASSTSATMPSVLQESALYPETILVGHPYHPSYLLPLIEVCGGKKTSEESIEKAMEIYGGMGKVPVRCRKETPGFLVNRLSWAAMDIAKEAVMEGICTVEDIDKAIMYGPGMRMAVTGQILTLSLGVQGGLRAVAEKYGKEPEESDIICADGVEAEISNRPEDRGNTVERVERFRDKMFVAMLKEQGLL
ncbi:MAG: 3-hydroxyacyl-CoA dehydrogenase family protein [Eubacterium sp.]|nr:3-hydroxyacyl-CoA dehydrogenase family protein [Eubacterium sp.]